MILANSIPSFSPPSLGCILCQQVNTTPCSAMKCFNDPATILLSFSVLLHLIICLFISYIRHLTMLLNIYMIAANSSSPSNYQWVSILLSFISALPHFIISLAGPASPPPPDPASLMAQFSLSSPFPQRAVPLLPRSPLLPSAPDHPTQESHFAVTLPCPAVPCRLSYVCRRRPLPQYPEGRDFYWIYPPITEA